MDKEQVISAPHDVHRGRVAAWETVGVRSSSASLSGSLVCMRGFFSVVASKGSGDTSWERQPGVCCVVFPYLASLNHIRFVEVIIEAYLRIQGS